MSRLLFSLCCLLLAVCPSVDAADSVPDTLAQRAMACTGCHGKQGRAAPDGYYPRLAGKPAGYLFNQLLNFRDGRRDYGLMSELIAPLSDAYLKELAGHFASLDLPYPPPQKPALPPPELARAEQLIRQGDAARKLPACVACHGERLTGTQPAIPGLLGLSRDYLNGQLGAWRSGQRRAQAPDCMAQIAKTLTEPEINAITQFLAGQALPADPHPAVKLAARPPVPCGGPAAMRRLLTVLAVLAGLAVAAGWGLLAWQRGLGDATPRSTTPVSLERGAYLAAVGNCAGCHTARGGERLAGGRPIPTPFGTVFSSNLTPDATGLGGWSADEFWRALHLGQGRDGRLLVPAHPIVNTTLVTREDADALHAWLQAQPAVAAPRRAHELRWPFGSQLAVAAWRALYFKPGSYQADPARDAGWNRGAYLSQGLGHCSACHAGRDALGGDRGAADFRGGLLAGLGWVAPSLHDPAEAGVQRWPGETLQRWLRDGHVDGHAALGPMGEVVLGSTAALNDADLAAMSVYLRALPEQAAARPEPAEPNPRRRERGASLYRDHCAACHGANGEGRRDDSGGLAYPALAGSRTITQASAANLIRVIERGGFAPATAGHPRPYGMPPFAGVLDAADLAALASHLRQSWGHRAGEIDSVEVLRLRAAAAQH